MHTWSTTRRSGRFTSAAATVVELLGAAATESVGAEAAELEPTAFVAVTFTRTVLPTSSAVTT